MSIGSILGDLKNSLLGQFDRYDDLGEYLDIVDNGELLDRREFCKSVNKASSRNILFAMIFAILGCFGILYSDQLNGLYGDLFLYGPWVLAGVFFVRYKNKKWKPFEIEKRRQDTNVFRLWINDVPEIKAFMTKNKVFEGCSYVEVCLMRLYVTRSRR